ncbi:MAG: thioredoxin family protein [Nitrososphaerota archaeon]|nr:thioredoxin family protein [Candidatus Calditenuis fumarioli]
MVHRLELFVGGCPICEEVLKEVTVGKCAGCALEVYDLTRQYAEVAGKLREYRIRCVPTLVIDGRIRIEGKTAVRAHLRRRNVPVPRGELPHALI